MRKGNYNEKNIVKRKNLNNVRKMDKRNRKLETKYETKYVEEKHGHGKMLRKWIQAGARL